MVVIWEERLTGLSLMLTSCHTCWEVSWVAGAASAGAAGLGLRQAASRTRKIERAARRLAMWADFIINTETII